MKILIRTICFVFCLFQSFDYLDKVGSNDDGDALCANQPECSHQVEEEQVEAKAGLKRESVFFWSGSEHEEFFYFEVKYSRKKSI